MQTKLPKYAIYEYEVYDWENKHGTIIHAVHTHLIATTDDEEEAKRKAPTKCSLIIENPTKKDLRDKYEICK